MTCALKYNIARSYYFNQYKKISSIKTAHPFNKFETSTKNLKDLHHKEHSNPKIEANIERLG